MREETKDILNDIDKWNKIYNNMNEDSQVTYYVQTIIKGYIQSEDEDYCDIIMHFSKNDWFCLKCNCGAVYCFLEYDRNIAGATFTNLINGKSLQISNIKEIENIEKLNSDLFDIFD